VLLRVKYLPNKQHQPDQQFLNVLINPLLDMDFQSTNLSFERIEVPAPFYLSKSRRKPLKSIKAPLI
jgi:hypothetical protein